MIEDTDGPTRAPEAGTAFRFTGTWQEFLPIALTHLLVTIVTLGIYRFWARSATTFRAALASGAGLAKGGSASRRLTAPALCRL